jgi:AraC-like DNA-binding protein
VAYREFRAPAPLRAVVECGWSAGVDAQEPPQLDAVYPDGCMDLVWTGAQLLVAGPDTAPHPSRREPGVVATGLRFAPGQLPAILGVPAAALRNRRVPLAELHAALARDAIAHIEHGDGPADVLVSLTMRLPGSPADPSLRAVVAHLGRGASAAETADALGWTTRSLHRRSLAAFGYGPAVLRRVLRFRRALELLQAGSPTADAAFDAGYADQPHLSREVRALAGLAPTQLASGANRSTALPSGSRTSA